VSLSLCIQNKCRKANPRPDFNEYFSNFKSVKHNDWFTLFLFYGVMKYV
jgi:hypothetical protein